MEIVKTVAEVRERVKKWRSEGLTVGLVPTMGFLHEGHQSLIKRAVSENDRVIVSVFVNPTQFGPNEDYEDYPRDIDKDAALCENTGASLIFNPEPEEMYPEGNCSYINMTRLTDVLCGKTRPIHFKGVCTVCGKLFHIAAPDRAYFGEKDAQQLAVIRRMVKDLNFDLEIVGCPIVREEDGLAKSSRNTYLNTEERKAALIVSRSIFLGKEMLEKNGKISDIKKAMTELINTEPLAKIDYVEIVDMDTLEPAESVQGTILCAVAIYIGKTRLIDNCIINK